MNELTNEELIMRIARTKASGLPASAYFKLMGFNKNYVCNARKQLTSRGLLTPEIDDLVMRRVDALRSWMDKPQTERDEFVSLYHSYLERPKDVSEHQFCSEAGIGDYEFRKLRAGYKYFTDMFEFLSSRDAAATVNTGVDGPIRIVYTGNKKEGVVPKCFVEETDLDKLKPGAYIPNETTSATPVPVECDHEAINKYITTKINNMKNTLPVEYDEEEQAYCKISESEQETTPDRSPRDFLQLKMARYDGDDIDKMIGLDIPLDADNMDRIYGGIAALIHAFMVA